MTTDLPITPDGLAQVRAMLATGRQPPLGEKLGISLVEVEYGHAVFEATPDGTSYNPMGTVHGGYISAILDSACGIAAHTGLKPGFGYTTLELKVSFLRPLNDSSGKIRAVAPHFRRRPWSTRRGSSARRRRRRCSSSNFDHEKR